MMRRVRVIALALLAGGLGACRDAQSVFAPQGPGAADIVLLAWVLFVGGAIIFAGVMALTGLAIFGQPRARTLISSNSAVLMGGVAFPAVTLTVLLVVGLMLTSPRAGEEDSAPLEVKVVGEQWWWRVAYVTGGRTVASANEITVPAGRPVRFELSTADVIHSFWVPNLAGKVDMIPGRTTRLRVKSGGPGVARGQCAEYCGGPHALMAFHLVTLAPAEFDAWMARESQSAAEPAKPVARRGEELFLAHGCGACHTVRGTAARGLVGPDLTHIGSRRAIAAAALPMTRANLARWIAGNQHIKPGNTMPEFRTLESDELQAVAAYLEALR